MIEITSLSVLIEPTSDCNLDCRYCYKGEKNGKTMSVAVFEAAAQKIIAYCHEHNRPLLFVWHGGEPTLAGADFYRHAFRYCAGHDNSHKIGHTLHTNGTLLSDDLLTLLAEYKVSIGISLDGPAHHHDNMRPSRNGGATHDKVIDGIQRARANGIDVGVLMSITNNNAVYINEMFQFCRENRLTFGLNPISADLHNP
ncbi:MAG: radical SAM protein [Nitrospirae bacterium]|nr:radical SAM protein [Nitrospirota bacterium]